MTVFFVSLFALIADQFTKYLAVKNLSAGPIEIIKGFIDLALVQNRGAAFGILQNGRVFFLIGTPIIIAAIIVFLALNKKKSWIADISLALIIGGALGNYIDRIKNGYVVDFLDFHILDKHWPVFNIADSCVVVGTILFAIYIYFIADKVSKPKEINK